MSKSNMSKVLGQTTIVDMAENILDMGSNPEANMEVIDAMHDIIDISGVVYDPKVDKGKGPRPDDSDSAPLIGMIKRSLDPSSK